MVRIPRKKVASRILARVETTAMNLAKGFDVEIGLTRRLLRSTCVYPDPNGFQSFASRGYFLIPIIFMLYFCNIPQSVRLKRIWGDVSAVIDLLTSTSIPYGIAIFKHVGLRYNTEVLRELVLSMSDDWKSSKTKKEFEVMWKNAKISRIISITIFSLATGSTITYFLMGLITSHSEIKRQIENNVTNIIRPLFIDGEFSYDTQKSPQFEITYFLQIVSMFYASTTFSAIDAFFAVLVLHLCGQLSNLKENLRCLADTNAANGEPSSVILFRLITNHQHLARFAESVEDTFNVMFLPQLFASALMIIFQAYQLVMIVTSEELQLSELIHRIYFTLCFTFSLFVYCYIAENLRNESMEVGDAVYQCEWHNLSGVEIKAITMIILRARRPFIITAGKIVEFSLQTYCSILKSSAGYVSVLLAMKDRLN